MSNFIVYHNQRCGKSRDVIKFLNEKNIPYTTHLYLEKPLKEAELKNLFAQLESTKNIIRTKENEFEKLPFEIMEDKDRLNALLIYPKLMERPIVSNGSKAIIARDLKQFEKWITNLK